EEHPLAQQDVRAVVTEERRLHPDRLPASAEEGREDAAAGLLVPLTGRIQVLAQIPGPFPGLDKFRGERIVQFPGQHLVFFTSHSVRVPTPSQATSPRTSRHAESSPATGRHCRRPPGRPPPNPSSPGP